MPVSLQFGDKGTLLLITFYLEFVTKSRSCQFKLSWVSYGWDALSVLEFVLYGFKLIRDGKRSTEQ